MNNKIDIVIKKIKDNNSIIGIAIVGSYQKEDDYNDIDFLVVSNNIKETKTHINKVFKDYKKYYNDDSIRITDYLDCEISFGMYNDKNITKRINNYLNGKDLEPIYKNWNIVGWLPECLLYDLNRMTILYEKNQFLTKIKDKITNYPSKMQQAIVKICDDKINNLSKHRKFGKLEKKITESEVLSLKIRRAFAMKKEYFNGYKRIDEKISDSKVDIDE